MDLFFAALAAHLAVDLALKTERMRAEKAALGDWKVYARHGLLVFLLTGVALAWQAGASWRALWCALALSLGHVAIDAAKHLALRWRDRLHRWLSWLLLDCHALLLELLILLMTQGLHWIAVYTLTGLFYPPFAALTAPKGMPYLVVLYLLGTLGGARVIQFVERAFYPGEIPDVTVRNVWEMSGTPLPDGSGQGAANQIQHRHVRTEEALPSPPGKPGASYWVGVLERLAIMLAPLVQGLGLTVTVVLGAKSIARYNQFKHRAFVDYFIVGTLASVVWGSAFAWLVYRALR